MGEAEGGRAPRADRLTTYGVTLAVLGGERRCC